VALSGQNWIEDKVPVGYVALGAVGVGAVLIAILLGGSYGGQRASSHEAEAKVERARVKLNELVAKIKAQRARIAELEAELEAARARQAPAPSPDAEPPDEGDEEFI
jgi:alkylation response protein AidB-like acyl-CoA dehydrogenase